MHPDLLGWTATAVLMATLVRQMEWHSPHPETVSKWLFIGQMTASTLFTIYSALLGATVFVVTNLLLLATALIGQLLAWRRNRATASSSSGRTP
ncbi:membrane protein [Stenotrophomonas maltophilia 5BA-I-2]|nr:membrane protein [Stenotrophomonas maltophilia 5BA-I-2]